MASGKRIFFMDAGRATFMLLGIPLHVGMIYSPVLSEDHFDIKSPETSILLAAISWAIHVFRMPAFFIIAGYFATMILERRPPLNWLKSRILRLGVPLLAAALLLNPLQMLVSSLYLGGDVWQVWLSQITSPGAQWIRHLWFLEALIIYCCIITVAWRGLETERPRSLRLYRSVMHSRAWLLVLIGLAVLWRIAVAGAGRTGALPNIFGMLSLNVVAQYLPYFVVGIVLKKDPVLFEAATRPRLDAALAALVFTAGYVVATAQSGPVYEILALVFLAAGAIPASLVAISLLRLVADRPLPVVAYLVSAAFTIYLFHQPILQFLALTLLPVGWPPFVECLIIVIATAAVCVIIFEMIKRVPLLAYMFGASTEYRPKLDVERSPAQ